MKTKYLTIAVLALALVGLSASAQNSVTVTNYVTITNTVSDSVKDLMPTNDTPEYGKIDITVGSAGSSYGGVNQAGVDLSVSIDPFEKLPELWVGVSQSLYWSPAFGGSTDVDADWNVSITDKICVLGGWSAGDVYGAGANNLFRTGPEVIAQYYFSDDVYLYGAVNYDLLTLQNGQGWQTSSTSNNGIRWSIGFGIEL
jgi:predicted porin